MMCILYLAVFKLPPLAQAAVPLAWYPFITLSAPVSVLIQICPSCTPGADGKVITISDFDAALQMI